MERKTISRSAMRKISGVKQRPVLVKLSPKEHEDFQIYKVRSGETAQDLLRSWILEKIYKGEKKGHPLVAEGE
jgi:hypothetical protein